MDQQNDQKQQQKIALRIAQLRACAKSTHSRPEAETMLAVAAKLIAEYQLSDAELEAASGKSSEEEMVTSFKDADDLSNVLYDTGRSTPWKMELVFGLGKLNGLYVLQYKGSRRSRYRGFGRKSDLEIAKYMFDTLVSLITSLGFDYVPGARTRGVNPERESWCLGCVRGFLHKMNVEKEKVLSTGSSAAMVLVSSRSDVSKGAWQAAHPKQKTTDRAASRAKVNYDAMNSGFRKGQTLEVIGALPGKSEV